MANTAFEQVPRSLPGEIMKSSRTFFPGLDSYKWLNCSFNLPLDRELARGYLLRAFFILLFVTSKRLCTILQGAIVRDTEQGVVERLCQNFQHHRLLQHRDLIALDHACDV